MNVGKSRKREYLYWLLGIVLVGLCATLGVIQYQWIGQVSVAEHERLQGNLQADLDRVATDFDTAISSTSAALSRGVHGPDAATREREQAIRFEQWRATSRYSGLVRRLAVASKGEDSLTLRSLDPDKGTFQPMDWPSDWSAMRERLTARAFADPATRTRSMRTSAGNELAVIDLPQFIRTDREERLERGERGERGWPGELGWTIIELDLDYVRAFLLPELLQRHLGGSGKLDYYVKVTARDNPATVIYDSDPEHPSGKKELHTDASIGLFEAPYDRMFRFGPQMASAREGANPAAGRGRWLLSVRHKTGSLEALVERTRRRSLAVTGAILLLMLAAMGALIQFSRRAQRLAELQMEFVAGVSHELRTPLSVIRTAAHNLGVRVIINANQVQRYGSLIEEQSKTLTDIVDRVLLFSNAKAGRVIREREVVNVQSVVEEAEDACAKAIEESRCVVETTIEPGTPPMFGDPTALKHALLNLINNAAKYAADGQWIGVSVRAVEGRKGTVVEIHVADRGPGIAPGDMAHIFDPFYRGKMAVDDQIHGTGLGLSLVKRIVGAHGGTVTVKSEPGRGAEFTMRIPAAPAERIDEFAESAS